MAQGVRCPACGVNVQASDKICPSCGQVLGSVSRAQVKRRFGDGEGPGPNSRTLDADESPVSDGQPSSRLLSDAAAPRPSRPARVPAEPVDSSGALTPVGAVPPGQAVDSSWALTSVGAMPPAQAVDSSWALTSVGAMPSVETPTPAVSPLYPARRGPTLPPPPGATPRKDPLIGARLGEYVVEERVGIGGMGIVYRAVQPLIGNSVAIKVLRPDVIADARDMKRLLDEAKTVNGIRHRSIISIFGAGQTTDGRQYLVMEFLEGESLEALLLRHGKLSLVEVLPILEDVLSALAAAHAAKIVHRDLKPANVFLVAQADGLPWVKLLDFGLARRSNLEDVSRIAGTPDYISPEHACGKSPGPAADLYAFGVMTFQLLTGRLPFTGASPMEVMEKHVHLPPPVPADVEPSIPPAMSELLLRLLDKEPANRPDAATVRADLKAAAKQLRLASTQVGLAPVLDRPPVPRPSSPGPESSTENAPVPASSSSLETAPRLQRLAEAIDWPRWRRALRRWWPWLVGGVAAAWLLALGVYLLSAGPRRAPVPMRYGDEDEARAHSTTPAPEPEPAADLAVEPEDPANDLPALNPPGPEAAPAPVVAGPPTNEAARPSPARGGWRLEGQRQFERLRARVDSSGRDEPRATLKKLDEVLNRVKTSPGDRREFDRLANELDRVLKRAP